MTGLYWAMIGTGLLLCVLAAVWTARSHHIRALWRTSRHNATTVAIVLELEERVQQLETREMSTSGAP
jgi:hypothetical protein